MNFKDYINISLYVEAFEGAFTDENTSGLGGFLYKLTDHHPELEPHLDIIRKFILNSGCKKIEFKNFKMNANGLALSNGVAINPRILNNSKENVLYIIFHEIAHQYQYKKYGNIIENLFISQEDEESAANLLRKIELVADQYAIRKCRELAKMGILKSYLIPKEGNYKHFTLDQFKNYLNSFRNLCKKNNVTDCKNVAELFYNYIINDI
jgi:hypothetical protein